MEESLKKNSMESTDSCGCGCGHDHHEEHEHEEHAHEEHHHHDDEHCGCGCEDHEHEHHHHDHDDDHCDCGCEDHEHEHHEHEHHHHHHDDDHCGCGCEDHDHDHHEHEHHHHDHDHEHHEHEHHHHHDDEHCGCGCGDHDHNHEHHEHSHSTASAKRVYILENLGCAHCASKMEEQIQHLDGVESATITFATKQLRLNAADPDALLPQIRKICTSIESEVKVVPRNPKPAASADVITKIYLLENLGCAHCASKMEEHQMKKEQILGIGVGVPAPVADGIVNGSANLGWKYKNVKAELEELTGIKVKVGNDANVAALGEMWKGGGQGNKDLIMVTLGTGVGGGIIVDGRILGGFHGAGGEIGHL